MIEGFLVYAHEDVFVGPGLCEWVVQVSDGGLDGQLVEVELLPGVHLAPGSHKPHGTEPVSLGSGPPLGLNVSGASHRHLKNIISTITYVI